MNKLIASLILTALAIPTFAQGIATPNGYYSANLVATNTVIAANGTTTLVATNYGPTGDGWVSTKGVTSADPNAVGVTVQVVAQPSANVAAYNLTLTFLVLLDDQSKVSKLPPASTGTAITVTVAIPLNSSTTPTAYLTQLPASTFAGAKWFKLVSVQNASSTANTTIISARAGFWY